VHFNDILLNLVGLHATIPYSSDSVAMDQLRQQFHRDGYIILQNGKDSCLLWDFDNEMSLTPTRKINSTDASLTFSLSLSSPALPLNEVQVLQREADCLLNFLFSEGVDIMKDHGGIIGMFKPGKQQSSYGPRTVQDHGELIDFALTMIEPTKCGYIDPPLSQLTFTSHRSFYALRNMVTEAPDTVIPILFGRMSVLAANFLPLSDPKNPLRLVNKHFCDQVRISRECDQTDMYFAVNYCHFTDNGLNFSSTSSILSSLQSQKKSQSSIGIR